MDGRSAHDKSVLNFTKAAIEALPVPERGWKYYYDTKVSGLAIGVGSTGVKTFVLYRKVARKPERIKIGRYPDLTVDKARAQATNFNADIANGANPAELKRARRAEMTFGDLFDQYYKNHSVPNKKTADEDKQKFDRYLSSNKSGTNLASRQLSTITKGDIAQLFAKISKDHKITANRVLALISSIFGKAIEWGIWSQLNPCQGIRRHRENSRDRFLHPDELPKFFDQVRAYPNATVRDYIFTSLLTGARRGNVLAMRWEQLNLERAEWRIPDTKNGTPQSVPLVPDVAKILRERKKLAICAESPFVFPGEGETGHLVEPKNAWKIILDKAGISDLRLHDLRRTMGSWQAGTGANLSVIGRSLNHKSTQTTAIYARLWMEPVRDSMETAASAMLLAADGVDDSETSGDSDRGGRTNKLMTAIAFAAEKHRHQRRKDVDATPYINHPIAVANLLANEAGIDDEQVLIAAILHDVIEDTATSESELVDEFGRGIADIVREVTDDKSLPKAERKRLQIEHAAHISRSAKLVKLADKICNLRDIAMCPPSGWSVDQKREYFEWAQSVVAGLRGAHPRLERLFDEVYESRLETQH